YNLNRFIERQKEDYPTALKEIQNGRKESHWMWWIFPQLKGLGFSYTSMEYGIADLEEAKAYLQNPYLHSNLVTICNALLQLESNDAGLVMGYPDDLKLCSSMTLFDCAGPDEPVFGQVIDKFFGGKRDERTIQMLGKTE
ncbi:MAG: DUF1810 domain-containing protein, partial [Lachnospiraceae bacterium]|nr:DUF1810 domain-containing protein [Lachnospiraceae bacterium]